MSIISGSYCCVGLTEERGGFGPILLYSSVYRLHGIFTGDSNVPYGYLNLVHSVRWNLQLIYDDGGVTDR